MPATPIDHPLAGESLLGIEPQLLQQVDPGWRHRLNLFTGRTLSDTALDSEQSYRAGLLTNMGQQVTHGVAKGLVLSVNGSPDDPILTVTSGYGISASGEDISVLGTLQTKLRNLAVIDPATGTLQQTFNAYASNPGSGIPTGVLILQPVIAEVNGQMFDTGTGPVVVSGNLNASCGQDPAEYAFEDWQTVDGARLVFVPWPLGVANLALPEIDPVSTWRNRLAYTIFNAEKQMAADQALPWAMLGVPVALAGFKADGQLVWKPNAAFAAGQMISDSNGNLQQIQTGGTSGATQPQWKTTPGQTTTDGTAIWINAGPGMWRKNSAYVVGQIVFDPQGNLQMVQTAGQSGSAQPLWNLTSGQTTSDNTVTWINNGRGNWRKANVYAAGQFIADSNGNIQTVKTAGTSGATQPAWKTTSGQTTQDGGVTWVNGGMAWKLLFVDRSSVVRAGGLPRRRYALPSQPAPTLTWTPATTFNLGQFIVDSNGNMQKVQIAGKSADSAPTWSTGAGKTTTDGTITWSFGGGAQWQPNTAYPSGQIIVDSNGNAEIVSTPGTSGSSEPDWSDAFLPTSDGTVTWINNGSPAPTIAQPELAQARIAQLSEQINDLLPQQSVKAFTDFATLLPPSGILPVAALDPVNRTKWFPANWTVEAGPVHLEELETALLNGMTADPLDIAQAEEVEVLFPLTDELYDPNILVKELVSPEFQHELDKATQARNDALRQRKAIQLELNALSTVLGPNAPPPNPNLIDLSAGLTPSEISGRDTSPLILPQPNSDSNLDQTFATYGPATWQANQKYVVGQFVIDPNGNIEIVTVAGTSAANQPTWNAEGNNTTDGSVTWLNNGSGTWQPGTPYVSNQFIFDINGNIQATHQTGPVPHPPPINKSGPSQYIWKPKLGDITSDIKIQWINQGAGTWQPNSQYTLGQVVLDTNGNVQVANNAGKSGNGQPVWTTDSEQETPDGTLSWINKGQPTVWEPNTEYAENEFILDVNGNVQRASTAGVSGTTQFIWALDPGKTTTDAGVTWVNYGPGTWQPNTSYIVGQFIFDSNGNIQTVLTAGTSGSSQPAWGTIFGQEATDAGITWIAAQGWASLDLQTLRAQAQAPPYTVTYTDTSNNQKTIPLVNDGDWTDLANNGLQHFIDRLNAKIKRANDLIDTGFLTTQTDIYRFRQRVLGATEATRLATSPILANIATGDTAAATATNLRDYFNLIHPATPAPPAGLKAMAEGGGGGQGPGSPPVGGGSPAGLGLRAMTPFKMSRLPLKASTGIGAVTSVRPVTGINAGAVDNIGSVIGSTASSASIGNAGTISNVGSRATVNFAALSAGLSFGPSQTFVPQVPGDNTAAQPSDIQSQSPIPGAQIDIRTLTIAQRLAQSPSQESLFYAVGNRLGLVQLLLALEITIDDLPFLVDPPPTGTWQPGTAYAAGQAVTDANGNLEIAQNAGKSGATQPAWKTAAGQTTTDGTITWINRTTAQTAIPTEVHQIWELRDAIRGPEMMTRIQSPFVPSDSDEAGLFSVGIRVVEQHTQLLRALESRVQLYVDFVSLCTNALNNIQNNIQAAQTLLKQLDNHLVQARQDLAFTSALLNDEKQRVDNVNAQRTQILRTSVQVIAYSRPRTVQTEQDVPSRQLVPGTITNPVPACLQQSISIPPELREIVSLLREGPVNWVPAIQSLLSRLERTTLLREVAVSIQARAALQLQLPLRTSSALTEPGVYGPVISNIFGSHQQIFRGYQTQRASFQPAQIANQSWSAQVSYLANVAAIADLTYADAVHAEVANATSRIVRQISSVATCLYARASLTLPADRLSWAEFLRGPGLTIQLQNLSVLPQWNTQTYSDRQQMQLLVDWLFQQIDTTNYQAMAFISDVIRVCILLASHAPINDVIAGAVTVRIQPILGTIVPLNLPSVRVASGMFVQLYSKGGLAAEAVVSDFDSSSVRATVTAVHTPGVYLEANDVAHFTTQQPRAAALRAFSR
jgi:hypothetical protein